LDRLLTSYASLLPPRSMLGSFASLVLLATSGALAVPVELLTTNKTDGGNSLTNPVFTSTPMNVTLDGGKGAQIGINWPNAKDGTNKTLAAPFTPAGGDQQTKPICEL
jgi:hypothetical protein